VGQERHEPFIEGSVFEGWQPVQDLPLCLDVLKHRASLDRGGIFLPKIKFMMDFCLCGVILNLKAFCFGAIPDIMIELIVYGSVPH
jgi:hypothetical protein